MALGVRDYETSNGSVGWSPTHREREKKDRVWGWVITLYSLDLPTYPNLVREFYGSITKGSGGFQCKLRWINITMNEELLCRILKISSARGIAIVHSDREGALKLIFDRDDINPLK